jgi:hypothetical protein
MGMNMIPIQTQVLVNQDVAKAGKRRQVAREIRGQNVQLTEAQDGVIVFHRFAGILQRDDSVADVDAALGCDL